MAEEDDASKTEEPTDKKLRDGRANLSDGYARISRGEVFLVNSHISQYPAASLLNHVPNRPRKLLMHNREISRLLGKFANRWHRHVDCFGF